MGVVSLRLNKNEESIINYLTNYYEEDKSSLIKHSLKEMYEDLLDNNTIDEYEAKENNTFVSGDDILKILQTRSR
jgi:phosphoribosylformylglycinamidine (FGAM) synthase PurS component